MKPTVGFALTGSFCTLGTALALMRALSDRYRLVPIVSETVASTDTRFFKKEELLSEIRRICGREAICDLVGAEPLGPRERLDLLLVCPCTGNTLSKMAHGITDTAVTMAAKAHRRCGGRVLVALSSNDSLSGSAPSLGRLLQRDGFFFVPLRQDDPAKKPFSLQFDPDKVAPAIEAALRGEALQPFFSAS